MKIRLVTILFMLTSLTFAQRMTIEYGVGYTDGVMSSGGVPWKAGITYDFGSRTYYLEKMETKWDDTESVMSWRVTQFGTSAPTLTVIGSLSGTFNYTTGDEWQTVTINNPTQITGKVAFLLETQFNSVYNDFDANDPNGDWMYYSPDGQWYHNSGYGGGANAIRVTVNTSNPLPVELVSFNARAINGKINLDWKTAVEINNYGFEIERNVPDYSGSVNRNVIIRNKLKYDKWSVVGFVKGTGNSNSPNQYSFVDESAGNGIFIYRLKQIDNDGKYEYSKTIEVKNEKAAEFGLEQNYPNPFNPSTIISYSLPQESVVDISIYSLSGELVRNLVLEQQSAGNHSIEFYPSSLSNGMYFYRLKAGSRVITKKLMLMK